MEAGRRAAMGGPGHGRLRHHRRGGRVSRTVLTVLGANPDFAAGLPAALLKGYAESRLSRDGGAGDIFIVERVVGRTRPRVLASDIAALRPDIIGFSIYAWNAALVEAVVPLLRRRLPRAFLIGGGQEASASPKAWLSRGGLDAVVTGEGEATFTELLRALRAGRDPAGLAGTLVRRGRRVVRGPSRPLLQELDRIPAPDAGLYPTDRKPEWGVFETARGCAFDCAFCSWPGKGGRVRLYSDRRVRETVRSLVRRRPGAKLLAADADLFQSRARGKRVLRILRKEDPGCRVGFEFETNPEHIDAEAARLADRPGLSFKLALQSVNPKAFLPSNRRFDLVRARRGVELMARHAKRARLRVQLVLGLPGDDLAGFRRSLDWVWDQGVETCEVYRLMALPGTPFDKECRRLGLRSQKRPPYLVRSTRTFSSRDLLRARRLLHDSVFLLGLRPLRSVLERVRDREHASLSSLCESFSAYLEKKRAFPMSALFKMSESSRPANELLPFQDWPEDSVPASRRIAVFRAAGDWARRRLPAREHRRLLRFLRAAQNRVRWSGASKRPASARLLSGPGEARGGALLVCWARDRGLYANMEGVRAVAALYEEPRDARPLLGAPLPLRALLPAAEARPRISPQAWGRGCRRFVFANTYSGLPGRARRRCLAAWSRQAGKGAELTLLDDLLGCHPLSFEDGEEGPRDLDALVREVRDGGWRLKGEPRRIGSGGGARWHLLRAVSP